MEVFGSLFSFLFGVSTGQLISMLVFSYLLACATPTRPAPFAHAPRPSAHSDTRAADALYFCVVLSNKPNLMFTAICG